jgi:hypothetical protein
MRETKHELKTEQDAFQLVWAGIKTWELRKDDRAFRPGDEIVLQEFIDGEYTDREISGFITFVSPPQWVAYGLQPGHVVFSFDVRCTLDNS